MGTYVDTNAVAKTSSNAIFNAALAAGDDQVPYFVDTGNAAQMTVAVASGPDGEFVFNVTHRPDVSFRDAVPTMPGFAARVTGTADGVVQVTARDPEAEG